jgi:uroporphyrinogen-III synthase
VAQQVERTHEKGPRPRVVWVSRAEPGAAATAARLRALGIEPIVEPVLEVRPIEGAAIDLSGVSALVFTSANAVAAFAERSPERSLRVFAVGDATAAAARTQKFKSVLSAQGDVKALASTLAARKRELSGVVYYLAAAEPSQDLAGALAEIGLNVRQTALYETVSRAPGDVLTARLAEVEGVLVHSTKGAKAVAAFLETHPAAHMRAFCLSAQVATPLQRSGLAGVEAAEAPNETALLALL